MANFSVTAVGTALGTQIVNTWWYRTPAAGAPTTADVTAVLDAWELAVRASYLGVLAAGTYILQQELAQGYHHDAWSRSPYLPVIRDVSMAGTRQGVALAPIVAAILSFRVEPVLPGPRMKNGARILTPVRRGYLSISPMVESDPSGEGKWEPAVLTSAPFVNFRNACTADLTGPGLPAPAEAIRVSQPLKDEDLRGFGNVASAIWRDAVSTRRSRKFGKGS